MGGRWRCSCRVRLDELINEMNEHKLRIGITLGDPNGIGPEVVMKALHDQALLDLCTPVIFGNGKVLNAHRKAIGMEEFNVNVVRDQDNLHQRRVNLWSTGEEEFQPEFGKPSPAAGQMALRTLQTACDALQNGKIDALVTGPIDKHTIQSAEFAFAGHTEYLQQRFGAGQSLMLLVHDNLRVGLVTGHVPVDRVAALVTTESITQKVKLMLKSLTEDFGIRKPRIAVLGLNPHAGDNGTIGSHEQQTIMPAIEALRGENHLVFGPYPADGFFGAGQWKQFDAVLAMYHDQGLAPFKALAFTAGVNFTAGLPVVRTSPDHGTAYDIAGKNLADETSTRSAIYLAIDVYRARRGWAALNVDPLKIQPMRSRDRDRDR
jgi:4-hydroxythreonine-4-phosphate dehydrogenase